MICPACGYQGHHDGPAHAYMSPSPACWARYGEVLAREYSDAEYWRSHRLLTDAYCGQHSIGPDRRARQSLYIHLAALMLHFEDGVGRIRSSISCAAPPSRATIFLHWICRLPADRSGWTRSMGPQMLPHMALRSLPMRALYSTHGRRITRPFGR